MKIQNFKKKGKIAFSERKFLSAMQNFSFALNSLQEKKDSKRFQNEIAELKVLSMLCDMALDFEDEARALFEYYQIIALKSKNQQAENEILNYIENFDKGICTLAKSLVNIQNLEADSNQGILYQDFQKLSDDLGFKAAFESLMFSSKIIFTSKSDFLSFFTDLLKNGYQDIATDYFETSSIGVFYDEDFVKIYQKFSKDI